LHSEQRGADLVGYFSDGGIGRHDGEVTHQVALSNGAQRVGSEGDA
jgi:hypothetical protein